jgi:hypothetical protein
MTAARIDPDNEAMFVYRDGELEQFQIFHPGGVVELVPVEGLTNFNSVGASLADTVIRAGDLDGDGLDDLFFNTTSDEMVVRWSSRDSLCMIDRVTDPLISGEFAILPPEDYNNDGLLDLLLYMLSDGGFLCYPGTGSDSLGNPISFTTSGAPLELRGLPLLGQLDTNPATDLIIPGAVPEQVVFVYNFATPERDEQSVDAGEPIYPAALVGDVDGTGIDDLVIRRDSLYQATDQNGFHIMGTVLVHDPSPTHFELTSAELRPPYTGVSVRKGTSGINWSPIVHGKDVDLDGDTDLFWSGYTGGLQWTVNRTGDPGVQPFGYDRVQGSISDGIHLAMLDTDNDGIDEAVVSGNVNARIIDLGTGSWTRMLASRFAFMALPADLDGDGIPEMLVPDRDSPEIRVFSRQPDGSYADRAVVSTMNDAGIDGFEVADFNNDGLDDIVVVHSASDTVGVYLGDPNRTLVATAMIPAIDLSLALKPTTLDFNHDGNTDLAFADHELREVMLYRGLGDGTFEYASSIPTIADYWLISADIDADGNPDIIGCDQDNYVQVSFLNENGGLDEQIDLFARGPVEVIAEDFNADGRLDIAAACSDNLGTNSFSEPRVWVQTGERTFSSPILLARRNAVGIAATDVNQDGVKDVVVLDREFAELDIFLGSPQVNPSCPADLNGDGELNFYDVSLFVQTLPDYNSDGSFDFFDVSGFLTSYSAGCP